MDKELKKQIKEATKQLIYENKKKKEFLNAKVDYNFLQSLIDKSNDNQNLIIKIKLKDGTVIEIAQKYQTPERTYSFNGEPSVMEIE